MRTFAFLPGALMLAAGVLWAAFTLRWTVPSAVLGGGGLLALAVGVAANWKGVREWSGDPRGVFALNTGLSTLLLVAALGLVNALAGLRAVTFDWTEAGRNTLAPETAVILERLGTDVVLKQMGRPRDTASRALLDAFASRSPRIRVETVDIDASPAEARRYSVTRTGSVVAEAGRRFRRVDTVTEPALATAVLQVASAVEPRVCFATGEGGHGLSDAGPQGLSGLASVLTASNYEPSPISLLAGDVPGTCGALVLAGVPNGLQPDALASIERYLMRGGRLLLAVDPPADPGVASFLARFGVTVGQGVVIETSDAGRAVGAGPENPISFIYHDHPITRGFDERTIFGRAVPLGVAPTEIGVHGRHGFRTRRPHEPVGRVPRGPGSPRALRPGCRHEHSAGIAGRSPSRASNRRDRRLGLLGERPHHLDGEPRPRGPDDRLALGRRRSARGRRQRTPEPAGSAHGAPADVDVPGEPRRAAASPSRRLAGSSRREQ